MNFRQDQDNPENVEIFFDFFFIFLNFQILTSKTQKDQAIHFSINRQSQKPRSQTSKGTFAL